LEIKQDSDDEEYMEGKTDATSFHRILGFTSFAIEASPRIEMSSFCQGKRSFPNIQI
jgi:hypothetical protein